MLHLSRFLCVLGLFGTTAHAMLPTPNQTPVVSLTATGVSVNTQPTLQPTQPQTLNSQTDTKLPSLITAFLVQTLDNQETLIPINDSTALTAGDTVEYQAYFTNHSKERIRTMTATLNIPLGTEFIGITSPIAQAASVDGNLFAHIPLKTRVNDQIQEVAPHFYRSLRWQLEDIGIGGTAVVKYRVKIQ